MTFAHDIIIRPIVTERSMDMMPQKKYTFEVKRDANKIAIRNAIEEVFGVQVESVNTMNMQGKEKRMGAHVGRRPSFKKAIVTLKENSKSIEFFDGMA